MVASITEIEATSGQEIMQLLQQGNARRSQAATAANEVSSRSHAVLQVVVRRIFDSYYTTLFFYSLNTEFDLIVSG